MARVDAAEARSAFSIPSDIAYFNCAYLSPLHRDVEAAGELGLRRKRRPWEVTAPDFFDESQRVRGLFSRLLHGDAEGVAILPSVSYGIGVAAANIKIDRNQNVVVLRDQFPSNIYPWMEGCKAAGADLLFVDSPSPAETWTQKVLSAINPMTAVVALPQCHWTDGRMLDLTAISDVCRSRGIPLVVDATQSLGVVDFDLQRIQPAFVVAAAYKWLLGPYSMAMMWVREDYRSGVPLEFNWITREGADDFSGLVRYRDALAPTAERYDVGERSNFSLLPMVEAALKLVINLNPPDIARAVSKLTGEICDQASRLGFLVPGRDRAPHLVGLRFQAGLPDDLASHLAASRIFVSIRGDAIRVAPHIYNNDKDVHRLIQVLKSALKR